MNWKEINKMVCSVELPVKYLNYSGFFDFDFIIASTCFKHPKYLEYFINIQKIGPRFTILDNGAFETGEAVDDDAYIELAHKLRPDVLVIPDVYKDNSATGRRAINFISKWRDNPVEGVDLMGVLQGDAWRVLEAMYDVLYASVCKYIGLPYATGVDRYQFLKAHPEIENVHILGLPVLTEVYGLIQLPNVISIDSSLPVKCAMDNKLINKALTSNSYVKSDETDLDTLALSYNLQMFAAVCKGQTNINLVEEE
jgi:hypothetical protein